MEFGLWLPVYGGWLRVTENRKRPEFNYCQQAARCAEVHGLAYLYASENYLNCVYGPDHQVADVWVYLSAIAATTSRIKLVGGLKPGFISPFVMAHMVSSLDCVSKGRMSLNLVCGWWRQEFEHCGVEMLDHQGRYSRADEYLQCLKGLWSQSPFSFRGTYYALNEVVLGSRPRNRPHPQFWISGHSDRAIELASAEADVFFVNGMSVAELSSMTRAVKQAAHARGRHLKIAANAFVLLEATDEEAKRRYERIVAARDKQLIKYFRNAMDESGAAVWAGLDESKMVDSNSGFDIGLIGSSETVANRLRELERAGVDILMCQFEDVESELPKFAQLTSSLSMQCPDISG